MPLLTVLRNQVEISATPGYERLMKFIAERARQDKKTPQWSARVSTGSQGRAISFVTRVEGFAELAAREEPEDMLRRIYGEADGNAVLESLGQGVQASSYGVSTIREDLSSQTIEPSEPVCLVTRLRATSTGATGVTDMIRKVVEAAAKVDNKRRYLVLQTAIGDLRAFGVVQAISDPAQLDKQAPVPELLVQAYGQSEGEKAFQEGSACIEQAETELSTLRPDLSNLG